MVYRPYQTLVGGVTQSQTVFLPRDVLNHGREGWFERPTHHRFLGNPGTRKCPTPAGRRGGARGL